MFIPHTQSERDEMLNIIGIESLEDLFKDIPEDYRFPSLDLPEPYSEMDVLQQFKQMADENLACDRLVCFLGAGAYDHYIPAAVDMLLQRGEFFTAYTPYQPEVSQGTLQAIFEFQSLIANLTGMEASNASHYDGATAAGEACLTAYHHHHGKRSKFVVSRALHPYYRETIRTYLSGFSDIEIVEAGFAAEVDYQSKIASIIDEQTALVIVQYPDFFGRLQDFSILGKSAHEKGALFAVSANPIALGLFRPPSEFGADIVVGEGQPLGIPMSYGGPYLGFFATRKELIRKMSGRLVGETIDSKGKRGYVLTLTAREQHIRREKATSNICTNQSLMALAATIYLSLLGKHGLREVSELCYHKAHYTANQINKIPDFKVDLKTPFFNEFAVKCPKDPKLINDYLLDQGILGGLPLGDFYPEFNSWMLIAVTEKISKENIDHLCKSLEEATHD